MAFVSPKKGRIVGRTSNIACLCGVMAAKRALLYSEALLYDDALIPDDAL